jgi:hemoglobin
MAKSLFEKYGGFAEVRKIVSDFYDGVLDDDLLAQHFRGVNMRRLIDHQTKMISSLLGGPAHIPDEQLARAHRRLNIKPVEFDRLVEIMSDTLDDHDFEAEDRQAVLGRIGNTRPFIVGD